MFHYTRFKITRLYIGKNLGSVQFSQLVLIILQTYLVTMYIVILNLFYGICMCIYYVIFPKVLKIFFRYIKHIFDVLLNTDRNLYLITILLMNFNPYWI